MQDAWDDLPRATLEALAIESYRQEKISLGFLAEMLGMGVLEADAWLAQRGVPRNYSIEDYEADLRDLAAVFPDFKP